MSAPPIIYLVGTNTEIGKTHVAERLLEHWSHRGIEAVPFKPAQSGRCDPQDSDAGRLCRAKGWPLDAIDDIAPFRYPHDLAPGCAQDPAPFFSAKGPSRLDELEEAHTKLQRLIHRASPQLVLCEGAGGLHVPMPGGTWQPRWIRRLATHLVVVAPTGLGTINHTLLTCQALRDLDLPILGIAWTGHSYPGPDLANQNMRIVEAHQSLEALTRPDDTGELVLLETLDQRVEGSLLEDR